MRPHDRLRDAVTNLSKADLRALANRIGTSRAALEDFADANFPLDPDEMAALETWHADFSLRQMLNDPIRVKMLADLLPIDGVAAYAAGEADLPAENKAMLRGHLIHGGAPLKTGTMTPAPHTSAEVDPETRRRGELAAAFKGLPAVEQERLLALVLA